MFLFVHPFVELLQQLGYAVFNHVVADIVYRCRLVGVRADDESVYPYVGPNQRMFYDGKFILLTRQMYKVFQKLIQINNS